MTTEEALAYLKQHQPMPPDWTLSPEECQKYEAVRVFFLNNPDPACIPLFLNSFGTGDLYEIYPRVEDVIIQFSHSEVLPHILVALSSEFLSVRVWTAEIAGSFPSPELIAPLARLLKEKDFDLSAASATALGMIRDVRAAQVLRAAIEEETDEELREFFMDCLRGTKEA